MFLWVNEEEHAGEEVLYKHWHKYYRENEQWVPLLPKETYAILLRSPFQISLFSQRIKEISVPHFYKFLTIRSKQVELRFITKVKHIRLFHCPHDMLCDEVKTTFSCFFENGNGNRATYFSLFNLWETVFLEIGSPVYS